MLIVIDWSMIFNDQETIINWERNVCRRINLAFILVILIANLAAVSEVHILLPLHKS